MKSQAATETLLIVGSIAISSLLFLSLVDEVKEWSYLLSIHSSESVSKDVASLISISGASPSNITIYHGVPEAYNLAVMIRFVNVTLSREKVLGGEKVKIKNISEKIAADAIVTECPFGSSCTGVSECRGFGRSCIASCSLGCCCEGINILTSLIEVTNVKEVEIEKILLEGKNVYLVRKIE